MKILVVGDAYCSIDVFRRSFGGLSRSHSIDYLQLDMNATEPATSESEKRIKEYAGSPSQIRERMADHDVLVVHGGAVTDAVLDASPRLRLVCCARGGPVNVDVEAATKRGIIVTNTPGKNAESVADLTLAFAVMLARGLPRATAYLKEGGSLGESTYEGARWFGHDLIGHTLGLVGYGNVGQRVAQRAVSFGMRVVVYDPYVSSLERADVAQLLDFDELLSQALFVSLHARATAENANMFGKDEFASMQQGSFFINTARETLVDEQALFDALSSGHLAGAALDVIRPPQVGRVHPLLTLDNVVVTPHLGGATFETLARGAEMAAREIAHLAAGERLLNVVNSTVSTVKEAR